MPTLFGKPYNRQDLERRTGQLSQIAGIRLMQLQEGREAGVRIADLRSGTGLRFQVSLDRGMDLSVAEYKGTSLAWRSAQGDVHPSYFESREAGWLRSFPGGLLTGCGLTNAGAPCVDDGEELGLHGRLSNIPATQIESKTEWYNDRCIFRVSGTMRENAIFRHNLALYRTIEVELGSSMVTVHDIVVNEGSSKSPLMLLYHINLGWPLLDDGAELKLNAISSTPRDEEAIKGAAVATKMSAPVKGYREQVFFHDLTPEDDGFATTLLVNQKLQLGVFVSQRKRELPRFIQWKMVGEGEYALGLEPANCWVQGRARERERGTLQFLEPGEQRDFVVRIGVLEGIPLIDRFIQEKHLR